jgi:hypothetical protein
LDFSEKPDYGYLKQLIITIAEKKMIEFDYLFDWVKENRDDIKIGYAYR